MVMTRSGCAGLKRGGACYVDVTDRTPRVLWKTGVETMEGLAEAWSTPTIARVRAGGARQNGEHLVIILGGGFAGDSASAGNAGNRLFMLDAATGAVLWHAGDQSTADLVLSRMTHGVASRVAVLDTDGDGFADRLYASDTGGRVWRFDVWNGRTPTGLITGGVFRPASPIRRQPASPRCAQLLRRMLLIRSAAQAVPQHRHQFGRRQPALHSA
jgi:type IV pilus assembly protein PilY1